MTRLARLARTTSACALAVLGLLGLGGCRREPGRPDVGTVDYVYDGDTVSVRLAGKVERVRLIGIDTPESVDPKRPVECGGPEASAFTRGLLPKGTKVRLVRDVEPRDGFDRLLAYVYRDADGLFVNQDIARQGHAISLFIEPNVALREDITAAVDEARRAQLGIWGQCPNPGS